MGTKDKIWHGKTALIIDDDQETLELISHILADVSCNCLTAATAENGLQKTYQYKPDIILMDWKLPGINGFEMVEQLKSDKLTRTIPIILMTGMGMSQETVFDALCEKADDYLRKPIERFELLGRLAANLRLYRIIQIVQERSERLARLNHHLIHDHKVD